MELIEAIRARHSVRKYTDQAIEAAKVAALRAAVERVNGEAGLNIQLVLDEPKAFSTGMWKYGMISGVRNYFVMAGPKGKAAEEKIGYHGEQLVLLAQTLGLNTCWVGLTYKKIPGTFTLRDGDVVHCVISLGYGVTPGVQHPQKPAEEFYESDGVPPDWFLAGVGAALLAPTAVNQQKFKFVLLPGNRVEARACHFEIGAGTKHFEWA